MAQRTAAGHNIGDLLLREGLISNAQLESTIARQRETDRPLVRLLVESGFLDDGKRQNFFKRHFAVPAVSVPPGSIDPILYTYIPGNIARRNHLVPVKLDKDGLVVAMEDPSDLALLDTLKEVAGLRIKAVTASTREIVEALSVYPEESSQKFEVVQATEFDPMAKALKVFYWPVMSALLLGLLTVLFIWHSGFQKWVQDLVGITDGSSQASVIFNLTLYLILTWGIWTMVMFEIGGLVFDDLQWRDASDIGDRKELKSRSKALRNSILLGWAGADRFYLGYKRMGFVKLFTVGLVGIWWIADVVLLLGNRIPDAAGRPLE